jgi:hypothetical protein
MPARAVTPIVVAVLALLGVAAPAASAATEVRTVPGEVVFQHGQRPGDPGNCSAIVFVQWADVPRTVSATAFYTWRGEERSKVATPPFDDLYEWVATYTVAPGHHWIQVGKGWTDGPNPDTCEDTSAKQRQDFGTEARVELTIEIDSAACDAAKANLKKRKTAVARITEQLRDASTKKAKARLREKLSAAKAKRKSASKRIAKVC